MTLDIIHAGGHNLKVKYDWFANGVENDLPTLQKIEVDTGFLREWHTLKTEGEDVGSIDHN